jgi:phospholipase C
MASKFDPKTDKIKHVVLLTLENRSFDQMLGGMQAVIPGLDGVDLTKEVRRNVAPDGTVYEQREIYDKQIGFDPHHEHVHVVTQLKNNNGGFIEDFVTIYPEATKQDRLGLMGFYPADFLPALHPLARHFAVCHRWFSSIPGPTWPNRNMLLSGTTLGKVKMPDESKDPGMVLSQTQDTIFDRLNEVGKKWKIYHHDFPCSIFLQHQWRKENRACYHDYKQFAEDVKIEETFPDFVFIEPQYYGEDENDDHPPHNIMKGQALIADVYNTLRSNPKLWEETLLIVLYDEHGGFFDHVVPPKAIPPGEYKDAEYSFDQLGLRVPALLISPWVKRGVVETVFDHTSVLRYLIDKWNLKELGARAASANSIECALQFDAPITDAPEKLIVTPEQLHTPRPELEDDSVSGHHQALIHAWSLFKDGVGVEVFNDIALSGQDPAAFKRRVYPALALLGYALKGLGSFFNWVGDKLVALWMTFQKEDQKQKMDRSIAEIKAAIVAGRDEPAVAKSPAAEAPPNAILAPKSIDQGKDKKI